MSAEKKLAELLSRKTGADNFIQYTITPFSKKNVIEYNEILRSPLHPVLTGVIKNRYPGKLFTLTPSGRDALEVALRELNLSVDDEVWIETTSNNFYISGCVTKTIEKFCRWSRKFSEKTKVIFINHEFGFPVDDIYSYRKYGLPIIEDCAFSFLSSNNSNSVGLFSDYLIVSFPKFLPVPWGGGLYSNLDIQCIRFDGDEILTILLNHYSERLDEFKLKQIANYENLSNFLGGRGLEARFERKEFHMPGVYMFKAPFGLDILEKFKISLNDNGIQSSVFYGENSYFIPCHHGLDDFDLEYISAKVIIGLTRFL